MTAPKPVPTLAELQRKARALYREASTIDDELKAQGNLMTSFAIVRQRRVMAALRPAVEYALLRKRRPESHAAAVRYIEGLNLSMDSLCDLGAMMCRRAQGSIVGPISIVLANDPPEVWTAANIAVACVAIASRAKPRDGQDAFTRLRFVLSHAWRLPKGQRKAALQCLTADTRAMLYGDRKALPYRSALESKRRYFAAVNAADRAGRCFS
jgi:hypothetical protein